jgi:uncharacterized protein YecT (DUF1311 family)
MVSSKNLILILILLGISQFVQAQNTGLTNQFSICMDNSNGVTANMLDCIGAETKRQEIRLNKAYNKLKTQLSPERKAPLQSAQRAWIGYREANCSFYADPNGGTMARVSASDCFMSATASRAKELENFQP